MAQPSSGETIEMLFKTKWVRSTPVGVTVAVRSTVVPPLPLSPGRWPRMPKITTAIRTMASAAATAGTPAKKRRFLCGGSVRVAGGTEALSEVMKPRRDQGGRQDGA